ncbi:hypothetical protein AQUCO_00100640v1 [Aquilegia coerulea]|uniref:EGF-like domain-containing protein n=1 Tax=Aquilegia coerulea TaxID=218851 RepID=A0A2G5FBA2_AQUCA|nr:hypothetical protein AQUCO_00100640v1 [Aquilegia coerulea]
MNSTKFSSCVILLFMFIATVRGIDSQPNDLPWVGIACEFIKCGEGKCVPSTGNNTVLPFDCECNSGWKKIEVGGLTYPACVIPNCTIDFNCGTATPPPPPGPLLPPPAELTGPCALIWCGEGTCVVEGSNYSCQCNEGADNLFGNKTLACLKECALGADCNGVGFGSQPPPPPPPSAASNKNGPNSSSRTQYSLTMLLLAAVFFSML